MNSIENYQMYISSMNKSVLDKLFFLDMAVDLGTVIDFGCAQGELLKYVKLFSPKVNCIGYDKSPEMIKIAESNKELDITFTSDLSQIKHIIKDEEEKGKNVLINISSTLHEVYSYSSVSEIDNFWRFLFTSNVKYISIRDMMISNTCNRTTSMINEIRVRTKKDTISLLNDFENVYGSISNNRNLIHFLLKYRYIENWKRELHENYLPITIQELFSFIPNSYDMTYYNSYNLPYIRYIVNKDFGIELNDNTHVKIFLERK